MQGRHRQKGQERAGSKDGEHVAEVRRSSHLDVLHHVRVDFPPLNDALFQHHQVFFQQDDGCAFLGDVHRGIYADAHVRRLHRGCIIDAVAHIAHGMPLLAQDGDDARFLGGRELREDGNFLRRLRKRFIIHRVNVRTEQHALSIHPNLTANSAGDFLVVAGENLHTDAVFPQGMNRVAGRFLRRIEESKEADEHHVLLIRRGELPFRRGICLLRNGNHAHTAAVELICLAQDVGAHLVRQRNDFSLAFRMGAARQHLLHRALGNQLGLALAVAHNDAHAPALEVKRDFVHLLEAGNQLIRAKLTLFVDDGDVNQVLEARLEVAVQERVAKYAVVRLTVHV